MEKVAQRFLTESCLPWLDACFQFNICAPTTTDSRSFEGNTKGIKSLWMIPVPVVTNDMSGLVIFTFYRSRRYRSNARYSSTHINLIRIRATSVLRNFFFTFSITSGKQRNKNSMLVYPMCLIPSPSSRYHFN